MPIGLLSVAKKWCVKHERLINKREVLVTAMKSYTPRMLLNSCLRHLENVGFMSAFGEDLEGSAVMFADISGFSKLAERLHALGSADDFLSTSNSNAAAEGAERMRDVISEFFSSIIERVEEAGGEIVRIAGDAMIIVWDGRQTMGDGDPSRINALAALSAAAELMRRVNGTNVGGFTLGLHIGIGVGRVRSECCGGQEDRWFNYVTGSALQQATSIVDEASIGEVAVSSAAWRILGEEPKLTSSDERARVLRLGAGLDKFAQQKSHTKSPDLNSSDVRLLEATVRQFVPAPVLSHLSLWSTAAPASLRRVTCMFMLLDSSTTCNASLLNNLFCQIQRIVYRRSGFIKEFSVDDKGTVCVIGFGATQMREDDALKAVFSAREIQMMLRSHGCSGSIGITTGEMFAGAVGNTSRREFALIGSVVNFAARLMAKAAKETPNVRILVDEATYTAAQHKVSFTDGGTLQLKGKPLPVPVWIPCMVLSLDSIVSNTLAQPMVGMQNIIDELKSVCTGKSPSPSAIVRGTPKCGSTSLLLVAKVAAEEARSTVAFMSAAGSNDAPFRALVSAMRTLAGLDPPVTMGFDVYAKEAPTTQGEVESKLRKVMNLQRKTGVMRVKNMGMEQNIVVLLSQLLSPSVLQTIKEDQYDLCVDACERLVTSAVRRSSNGLVLFVDNIQDMDKWSVLVLERLIVGARSALSRDENTPIAKIRVIASAALTWKCGSTWDAGTTIVVPRLSVDDSRRLLAGALHVTPGNIDQAMLMFFYERCYALPGLLVMWANAAKASGQLAFNAAGRMTIMEEFGFDLRAPSELHTCVCSWVDSLTADSQKVLDVCSVVATGSNGAQTDQGGRFSAKDIVQVYPWKESHAYSDFTEDAKHTFISERLQILINEDILRAATTEKSSENLHRFRWLLFQDTVYHRLPRAERRSLHEKEVEVLEAFKAAFMQGRRRNSIGQGDATVGKGKFQRCVRMLHHCSLGEMDGRAREYLEEVDHDAVEEYAMREVESALSIERPKTGSGEDAHSWLVSLMPRVPWLRGIHRAYIVSARRKLNTFKTTWRAGQKFKDIIVAVNAGKRCQHLIATTRVASGPIEEMSSPVEPKKVDLKRVKRRIKQHARKQGSMERHSRRLYEMVQTYKGSSSVSGLRKKSILPQQKSSSSIGSSLSRLSDDVHARKHRTPSPTGSPGADTKRRPSSAMSVDRATKALQKWGDRGLDWAVGPMPPGTSPFSVTVRPSSPQRSSGSRSSLRRPQSASASFSITERSF